MWIDSHCHLSATAFDADRATVLERAQAAGVKTLLSIGAGYGIDGNGAAIELAHSEPGIFATAGVHPHDAALWHAETSERLRGWLADARVVAVGECGLDYHYLNSPREIQRTAFAEQLALARECALPVSIHVRDDGPTAYEDLLDIWRVEGGGSLAGVLHCYTYSAEFAQRALEQNLYISFSGILTFKRDRGLRDVAAQVPLERTLIETDAPFLAPQQHRGQRNEPAWITEVGGVLAQIHGCSSEAIAAVTSANARALFRLPEESEAHAKKLS